MVFRFAARALLELGRELISSDEVALYELIKNAVDAKSLHIQINLNVVLPRSAYAAACDALDDGCNKTQLMAILLRGIDISAPVTQRDAFIKAVSDAPNLAHKLQAALDTAYGSFNFIEVVDEGHGMSLEELGDVYLTVGTRSRRASNIAGAQYLGDKGVGRLSTMRLGDWVHVTTSRAGESHFNILAIDWTQFSHDSALNVSDIEVTPSVGLKKSSPANHGTTIRISHLTADWSGDRFNDVLEGKIARMVDPFEKGRGNKLITSRFNGKSLLIPSISEQLLTAAHATCRASFSISDSGQPVLTGSMNYRLRNASREIKQQGAELLSISQRVFRRRGKKGHAATSATPLRLKALQELGPFEIEVYWYNRLVVEAVEGLTSKRTETREQIGKWSGGPMIFRRGFRILPYGEPGDDWLELDKNAFGQSGFKLNRQQVIGRVKVTAGHAALSEQTNREGLVQSDARDALRIIVMWLMHNEFRGLINDADEAHALKVRKGELAKIDLGKTSVDLDVAFSKLKQVAGPSAAQHIEKLQEMVERLTETCRMALATNVADAARAKTERERFVQLAGIGLMTEFIFHELDRTVNHTLRVISTGQGQRLNLSALEEQLVTLQKRVSAFDEFTGERRQTKSTFDVRDVIKLVLDNHQSQFQRHGITATVNASSTMMVRAVKGMIVQILENLVSNAVYWLKAQREIETNFHPELLLTLNSKMKTLSIEDNGVGVDPSRKEVIFQPFVSSKPPGEGRGLGLYISRDLAEYHAWTLEMDEKTNTQRQGRLNTFILEMGSNDD